MILRLLLTTIGIHVALSLSYAATLSNKVDQAIRLMSEGKTEESLQCLKSAAATNDMGAQFYLGQCYESGIGLDIDTEAAFSLYRRAAERGFSPAMIELARCYKDGVGIPPNMDRAREWTLRYQKKGNTENLLSIKQIYLSSIDSPVDKSVAGSNLPPEQPATVKNDMITSTSKMNTSVPALLISAEKQNQTPERQFTSDVDVHIPTTGFAVEDVFALIIANENYQDVAPVANAINDGEIMAEYCNKTLGLPSSNIHLVKDATLNNLKRELNLLDQIAKAYNGEISLLIYYAGHGVPDEKTTNAYLMPVDGYGTDLSTCYSLSDFYRRIGEIPSKKTVICMDACFSGSSRGNDMLYAARGIKLRAKPSTAIGKTVIISSAQGDETAYPYAEQNHGLFTYFLLKKLKESKGEATLGEIFDYVSDNVAKKSLLINHKTQTPAVIPALDTVEDWRSWKLN